MTPDLDDVLKVAQIFALGVGGVWVLRNYIRGRTDVSRIQLALTGTVISKESGHFLVVKMALKNSGLVVVNIKQQGTALLFSRLKTFTSVAQAVSPPWEREGVFEVFIKPRALEPGVTVDEEQLIALPNQHCDFFLLQLRVVADTRSFYATAVVNASRDQRMGTEEE